MKIGNSFIGRWLQVDPLAKKYRGWSPYVYCLNNPICIIDEHGDTVVTKTLDSQTDILNTIPRELRKYIKFDESGKINVESLKEQGSEDINVLALINVSEAKNIIEVGEGTKMDYVDQEGNFHSDNMGMVFTGFTAAPDNSNYQSTKDNTIEVTINSQISPEMRAKFLAEELYGHAQFFIENKDWIHHWKNNIDMNIPLKRAI